MHDTTYIRHSIDGEPPTVNQASVYARSTGFILITVRNGTTQLDLIGDPQQFINFADQLVAIATKAERDRAAAREAVS